MSSNNNQSQSISRRFLLVAVDVPTKENGMKEMSQAISACVRTQFNRNCEVVFVKGDVATPIFDEVKAKYEASYEAKKEKDETSFRIHNHIKDNIEALTKACHRSTWFPKFDALMNRLGNVENLFKEGRPDFRITFPLTEGGFYTYYLQEARMSKEPHIKDGSVVSTDIHGEEELLYLYTFEFVPGENVPELQDCLGTKSQYPEGKSDPQLIKYLKDVFASMVGWGIPGVVVSNGEQIWYDQSHIRMGIDGNTIYITAPAITTFENTIKQIIKTKLSYATAQAMNVTPQLPTTTTNPTKRVNLE